MCKTAIEIVYYHQYIYTYVIYATISVYYILYMEGGIYTVHSVHRISYTIRRKKDQNRARVHFTVSCEVDRVWSGRCSVGDNSDDFTRESRRDIAVWRRFRGPRLDTSRERRFLRLYYRAGITIYYM